MYLNNCFSVFRYSIPWKCTIKFFMVILPGAPPHLTPGHPPVTPLNKDKDVFDVFDVFKFSSTATSKHMNRIPQTNNKFYSEFGCHVCCPLAKHVAE